MKTLVHPSYFGPISLYQEIIKANEVQFEAFDNFQKQTYRNRMYIYGANGKLQLNIPIKHGKKSTPIKTKDIRIENNFDWQKNHWKSIEAAYRSSPYFEFFEDEIIHLYKEKQEFLFDFNLKTHEFVSEVLGLNKKSCYSSEYQIKVNQDILDKRELVNAKSKTIFQVETYDQVFQNKYGFIGNLSILDLIFNEGPNAVSFLE